MSFKNFSYKKKRDPWVTDELRKILYEKDRLLKRAKSTNNENNWIATKAARNEANIMTRNSKSSFIKENLEIHKNDSKAFWKNINTILPQKKQ